jgi:hypothetical protein
MDNEPPHSPLAPEPSDRRILLSALAWVGVIFMFVFIVLIAYVPNRSVAIDARDVEARQQIRLRVETEQEKRASTYEWINQAEGQVRLPIGRARELIVEELRSSPSAS